MAAAAAALVDDGARSYGSSWTLVRRMFEQNRFRGWTYSPLLGGFVFSMSTIVLRRNMKAMLITQGIIGVGTIGFANAVATTAIVKERL